MIRHLIFEKYSATGNDFIAFDNRNENFPIHELNFIQKLCHRKNGIGADGIILIENAKKNDNADFKMQIINSDGTIAEMCGNGGRVALLMASKIFNKNQLQFRTMNSLYRGHVKESAVTIEMTELYDEGKIDVSNIYPSNNIYYVNTGVPHTIIEVDHVEQLDILKEAPNIRFDKRFAEGTNVDFFQIIGNREVFVRIYERGVENETWSCGTGITAVAWYLSKKKGWNDSIIVKTKGGELCVSFDNEKRLLSGKVDLIFQGKYFY